MEVRKETSYATILLSVLGGLAAGVGVGLLIAPEEGKESRRKLLEWLREKRLAGRDGLSHKREQVEAAIEAGRKAYRESDHKKPVGV